MNLVQVLLLAGVACIGDPDSLQENLRTVADQDDFAEADQIVVADAGQGVVAAADELDVNGLDKVAGGWDMVDVVAEAEVDDIGLCTGLEMHHTVADYLHGVDNQMVSVQALVGMFADHECVLVQGCVGGEYLQQLADSVEAFDTLN